jgi:hypothetical protein
LNGVIGIWLKQRRMHFDGTNEHEKNLFSLSLNHGTAYLSYWPYRQSSISDPCWRYYFFLDFREELLVPCSMVVIINGSILCLTFFLITTIVINFPLAFLLLKTSDWTIANQFGIINASCQKCRYGCMFFLGVALPLIGAYTLHLVEHRVKPLWTVHLVLSLTDHNVDTTTANRHHPLESLIRYMFTLSIVF